MVARVLASRRPPSPHLDQRIGLGRARRDDAARPVILEAPAISVHAIGDQGRGKRIAGMAGEVLAVEGEAKRSRRSINPPLRDEAGHVARRFAHRAPSTARDLMGQRIALDHQPGAAAAAMMPIFVEPALGIVAHDRHSRTSASSRRLGSSTAALDVASPRIGELLGRPRAAMGASISMLRASSMQVGRGALPFSSIMWPRAEAVEPIGGVELVRFVLGDRWAKHQPEAGVALKPP